MAYPTSFDTFTTKNPGDTINAAHMNSPQTSIISLEEKLGIANTATALTASTNTALLGTGASATGYQVISLENISLVSGVLPVSRGGTASASASNTAGGIVILDSNGDLPISQINVGGVVQVVNYQTGAMQSFVGATAIPQDNTIPQKTEGHEVMTLAITPTSATNKLKIEVVTNCNDASGNGYTVALFQDDTANAIAAIHDSAITPSYSFVTGFTHYMTAGTTSATTFKVRIGMNSAGYDLTFNGIGGVGIYNGVCASSITITEVKA